MKLSIIITAYESHEFIEICLNSIAPQTFLEDSNNEIEVLLGIDACKQTLAKVQEIRSKYPFLKVFWAENNVGTYILRNSLVKYANYENLVFFDSDDIMFPNMLKTIAEHNNSLILYCFLSGRKENGQVRTYQGPMEPYYADGTFSITKELFNRIGGFMPWKCAADTYFRIGCEKNSFPITLIKQYLFVRMNHDKSLTHRSDTGMQSKLRKKYITELQRTKDWIIPIITCTTGLIRI